jgi:hypothetical protein
VKNTKILSENLKKKHRLNFVGAYETIILKWIKIKGEGKVVRMHVMKA